MCAELLVYDTVSVKNIDPVVQLGTFEELITGRVYDEVVGDPRSGRAVTVRDGGERLVLTLTDELSAALAMTGDEVLEQAAVPWSETEEFWNAVDPRDLADFIMVLSGLVRSCPSSWSLREASLLLGMRVARGRLFSMR